MKFEGMEENVYADGKGKGVESVELLRKVDEEVDE